jgi:pilus assembly protein Flp/PilA
MVSLIAFTAGIKTRLFQEEKGATAVEYGIMVALIAVVIIVAVGLLGTQINIAFEDIVKKLGGTIPGASA